MRDKEQVMTLNISAVAVSSTSSSSGLTDITFYREVNRNDT